MRKLTLILTILALSASNALADFPETVTIGGKMIEVRQPAGMRKLGFRCEDIPWKENAARVLIEAMNVYEALPEALERDRDFNMAVKKLNLDDYAGEMEIWLGKNKRTFELLEQADRMGKCEFPTHKARSAVAILLPDLTQVRNLSYALRRRAAYRFGKGRRGAAVDDCFMTLRLGDRVCDRPMLIGWLVGVAVEGIAMKTLDQMVMTGDLDEKALADLATRLAEFKPRFDDYPHAMRAERAWALQVVKDIEANPDAMMGDISVLQRIGWRMVFRPEKTRKHLNAVHDFYEANAKRPAHEAFKPENRFAAYAAKHGAEWDFVTRMLVPALDKVRLSDVRRQIGFELLELRIALERYRLAKKAYPRTLDELVPACIDKVPVDPFTNKPYRYERTADGFRAWSIAEDLEDNQGVCTDYQGPDIRITQDKEVVERDE